MTDPLRLSSILALGCVPVACGGVEGGTLPLRRDHERPPAQRPSLTSEQHAALQQAELLYRREDERFAGVRDRLGEDPTTAYFLATFLLRDLYESLNDDIVPDDEAAIVLSTREFRDGLRDRAADNLVAMGAAAVSAIQQEVLIDPKVDGRIVVLALDVLGRIGPPAIPALEPVLESPDPKIRRRGVDALAAMGPVGVALERLRRMTRDRHFGVRGAAWRGLGNGGAAHAAELRGALRDERDPYVRRQIAAGLGAHRSRANASALIDYLDESVRAGDARAIDAAARALTVLAGGQRLGRVPARWRAWLEQVGDGFFEPEARSATDRRDG